MIKPKPGEYSYCGMHDSGPLISPRESGHIACLIASVQEAKMFNDTYLTAVIDEKKRDSSSPAVKKPKTDELS
jgi:hypothetical protein